MTQEKQQYIDEILLTQADIGRWVEWWPGGETGRIKSWNKSFVFVVYGDKANKSNWRDYTAAATHPKALHFKKDTDPV